MGKQLSSIEKLQWKTERQEIKRQVGTLKKNHGDRLGKMK